MPQPADYIKHFNTKSNNYLQFRPTYPTELFNYLCTLCGNQEIAWDCATGNGQAALTLAKYFNKVIATDSSEAQLAAATKKDNINYHLWPAEHTKIADKCIDLVTVAQALHWFNLDAFYAEVRRVSKPTGILAAWCYSLGHLTPEIDPLIEKLYAEILADCWPKERTWIDERYQTISFPFQKVTAPEFFIEKQMNLNQLYGYLSTWSAIKEYQLRYQKDPLQFIINDLVALWGDPATIHTMHWSIHLLIGNML